MAYYERRQLPPQPPKISKKEAKSRVGNWVVLALLVLTVLASIFFWAKRELPGRLRGLLGPATLFSIDFSKEEFDSEPVLAEIHLLTGELKGSYGVYVYQFTDGHEYGFNQDQVFAAASLDKLPIMVSFYQEVEAGNIEIDEELRGLVQAMGKSSDNAAKASIVKLLGEERIQQTIDELGMTKTSFAENETTPKDIGRLYRKLYQGGVVSDEYRDEILDFLTETDFEERIPAGVPEGVRVAHKIGTEEASFSDAGIIFAANPYVLVIMNDGALEAEALKALPEISRIVWEAER